MAIYAVGDIQGCRDELDRLLETIDFDPAHDRLWLVGDLVNRGPDSLGVLRRIRKLGDAAITVLGNHDLHLLAVAEGIRKMRRNDTLEPILRARDRKKLLNWLRRRPLIHRERGYLMVHAGLAPEWTATQAVELAREIEGELRGDRWVRFLERYREGRWRKWSDDRRRNERLISALRYMTRVRAIDERGRPDDHFSGPPSRADEELTPWFDVPSRRSSRVTVVCGHWAALGLRRRPGLLTLDTGCVWGGAMTAVRLDDGAVFQESARRR